MIGDNPSVDIKGAQQVCLLVSYFCTLGILLVHNKDTVINCYILHFQAGHPWFSILTRTGVFKGKENDADFPADLVGV